jgi:phage gp29-like protein
MGFLKRVVNAAVRCGDRRPGSGMVIPRRDLDTWRGYPADGLTPQRLVSIMREADTGSWGAQMELAEQMEERDPHLFSVASTRRLAVTGLAWRIVSAGEMGGRGSIDAELASRTAAYCDEVLRDLPGLEETLSHLSLAVGRNIAVAELVWAAGANGLRLAEVVPVDGRRLTVDEENRVRVLTEEEPVRGMALPPNKFIVHIFHAATAHPMRGGLPRVTGLAFMAKHFAIKDWLIFAEVFGMPVRVAKYDSQATPQEKRELLEMLRGLGADATGIFSKAVELQIIPSRSPGETNLYENLCLYFDREISKAWLGQTLTTDTARMLASAGAAKVHDQVRRDLRDDDLRKEAATLRRDLLTPMVRMQFGADAPVPYFQRSVESRFDPARLAEVLDTAINKLGARVPSAWVHANLGIPMASADEATLSGKSA